MAIDALHLLGNVLTMGHRKFFQTIGQTTSDTLRVAAGDPALPIPPKGKVYPLPETLKAEKGEIRTCDYTAYLVSGNSMYPKGISDGNWLLVKKKTKPYVMGDFIIVKVDTDYYKKYKPNSLLYDYKLRYAIRTVSPDMQAQDIVNAIKDKHFEVRLDENAKNLASKYAQARKAYPEEILMLSTTYHDGKLSYSFHPVNLIIGKAIYAVTREGDGMSAHAL